MRERAQDRQEKTADGAKQLLEQGLKRPLALGIRIPFCQTNVRNGPSMEKSKRRARLVDMASLDAVTNRKAHNAFRPERQRRSTEWDHDGASQRIPAATRQDGQRPARTRPGGRRAPNKPASVDAAARGGFASLLLLDEEWGMRAPNKPVASS